MLWKQGKKTVNEASESQGVVGLAVLKRLFRGGCLEVMFVQRLDRVEELAMQISDRRAFQAKGTTTVKSQRWEVGGYLQSLKNAMRPVLLELSKGSGAGGSGE